MDSFDPESLYNQDVLHAMNAEYYDFQLKPDTGTSNERYQNAIEFAKQQI